MKNQRAFIKHLKRGQVYRRSQLVKWSSAVDRTLAELVENGTMQKVSPGVYYYPEASTFGKVPPDETALIRSFLKDDRFLIKSPNAYNGLGVGTTQLYNKATVYNHKRHGDFKLGNRVYEFQMKHHFPNTLSNEFLLVDLVNNLNKLAEEPTAILKNVAVKVQEMDQKKIARSLKAYGNLKTQKILSPLLTS